MTTLESIKQKARSYLRLSGLVALPGIAALVITLFSSRLDSTNSFVAWCISYWWLLLMLGAVSYLAVLVFASAALRCPSCSFRFSRAGITLMSLAVGA